MSSNSSHSSNCSESKYLQRHLQMMQHQQQHSMPASMTAAMMHGMQVLPPPPIVTAAPSSSTVSESQQQQQQQGLGPPPTWAYAHPALMPLDPQTESLAENWRQFQQAAYNYNLDPHLLAIYGGSFAAGRADLAGQRRKNATRETTGVLKAWLNEHKKNPYPTKGEKIMLAIITTMTLTQVSTWFANARRRLKKENKMTWAPRNRGEDAHSSGGGGGASADNNNTFDGDINDDDVEDDDDIIDEAEGAAAAAVAAAASAVAVESDRRGEGLKRSGTFFEADIVAKKREHFDSLPTAATLEKPKIWSIVDTATKVEPPKTATSVASTAAWMSGAAKLGGGLLFPPPHHPMFPGMAQLQHPPLPPPSMLAFQPHHHHQHHLMLHQAQLQQQAACTSFAEFAALSAAFARPQMLPPLAPPQTHHQLHQHHQLSPGSSPTQAPPASASPRLCRKL